MESCPVEGIEVCSIFPLLPNVKKALRALALKATAQTSLLLAAPPSEGDTGRCFSRALGQHSAATAFLPPTSHLLSLSSFAFFGQIFDFLIFSLSSRWLHILSPLIKTFPYMALPISFLLLHLLWVCVVVFCLPRPPSPPPPPPPPPALPPPPPPPPNYRGLHSTCRIEPHRWYRPPTARHASVCVYSCTPGDVNINLTNRH